MGQISLEGRRIEGAGGIIGGGHLYLIYTDDLGQEWVIRGGPQFDVNGAWGNIVTIAGDQLLAGSPDARNPGQTSADRGSIILDLGGRSAADVWAILSQQAKNIDQANLAYTVDYNIDTFPFQDKSQDSNSVIASVLHAVGLSLPSDLPLSLSLTPLIYPGSGDFLAFDYHLAGTDRGDFIQGYVGNDSLNGGPGGDTLIGGAGADTFVFDTAALADAQSTIHSFDRIVDYDQGKTGTYNADEGDLIDLSTLINSAYAHGEPLRSLVRAVEDSSGTFARLQIDVDGTQAGVNWVTIARLHGLHFSDSLNVILDRFQPSVPITVQNSNVNSPIANTVVLQPGSEGQDLWITNFFPRDGKYGVDNGYLQVGGWSDLYYSLVKFDLSAASLPANVTSVTLRLYSVPFGDYLATGMYVDELHTSWTENYGWYDYSLSYTNIGSVSTPGLGWIDIDVTVAYNDWLANPSSNFGLQLRPFGNNHNLDYFISSDAIGDLAQFRPELVVTYNLAPPAPPTVIASLLNDTGSSITDKITSISTITGSGDPNAVVHFTIDGVPIADMSFADSSGTWTFTPKGLTDGTHTIVASETNASGITGMASLTFTLDTNGPIVIEGLTNDTGASASDKITKVATLSGTGDPNAVVHITIDGTVLATATADSSGAWTFAPSGLSEGPHGIVASESDAAGNTATTSLTFTLDTHAPTPEITSEVFNLDARVALSGTSEANSIVSVFDNGSLLGTATAGIDGAWSFTTGRESNIIHAFSLAATDAAGNVGSSTRPAILGTSGSETLSGTSGDDVINAAGGNDIVNAGSGNDTITGGGGSDVVLAGDGNDTFIAMIGDGDDFYAGGAGTDTLSMSAMTVPVTINLNSGFAFSAQTGVDGLASIENAIGGSGNDTMTGNGAANVLDGRAGNDTIVGGAGADQLSGGPGNDHFVFNFKTEGLDQVMDFNSGDVFDFSRSAFGNHLATGAANTGTLDASHFVANSTGPMNAAQEFWYNTANQTLYYDADGSGHHDAPIAMAHLVNGFMLHNTDIHLV